MGLHRSIPAIAVGLALAACGGETSSGADASVHEAGADAADAKPDTKSCLPNGTPITPQSDNCCSGYGHNGFCEAHCYPKGSACELPDRPCCDDSGATCINGGCQ